MRNSGALHATAVMASALSTIFHELPARNSGCVHWVSIIFVKRGGLPVLAESGLENGSLFRAFLYIVSKFRSKNP